MELKIFEPYFESDWLNQLQGVLESKYMEDLLYYLRQRKQKVGIYPKSEDTFKVFKLCPYNKVKVVILGQD